MYSRINRIFWHICNYFSINPDSLIPSKQLVCNSFILFQRMYEIFKNAFVCGQVEANSLDDLGTGKSLSEPFILASANSQYDKRMFIDLPVLKQKLQTQNML